MVCCSLLQGMVWQSTTLARCHWGVLFLVCWSAVVYDISCCSLLHSRHGGSLFQGMVGVFFCCSLYYFFGLLAGRFWSSVYYRHGGSLGLLSRHGLQTKKDSYHALSSPLQSTTASVQGMVGVFFWSAAVYYISKVQGIQAAMVGVFFGLL